MTQERAVFTPAETAALLGCSRAAIYKRIKRGQLQSVSIGHSVYVPVVEIDRIFGRNEAN